MTTFQILNMIIESVIYVHVIINYAFHLYETTLKCVINFT